MLIVAKMPFMKFFPRDWMGDDRLRLCSVAARGLWIDLLCLMHSAPRRGYLQTATGIPLPLEQIARMAGCSTDEASRLLQELISSGVCDCSEHGLVYSRRMVREAGISLVRSEIGRKGANVTNSVCRGKTPANDSATVSANSRPSEAQKLRGSEEEQIPAELDSPEFRTAWDGWLKDRRDRGLKKLTPRGESGQLRKLTPLGGVKAIACIEESIANGWQGLFPERFMGVNHGFANGRPGGGVRNPARVECKPGEYGNKPAIIAGRIDAAPPGAQAEVPDRKAS
jgi:hypothetical protein